MEFGATVAAGKRVNLPGGELVTSPDSAQPTGDVFADQKVPGLHLSLGETFPEATGATWTSKSWIALTLASCDVEIDRSQVIRAGRYIV